MSNPGTYSQFLIKKDGKLVFKNSGHRKMFQMFADSLQEGQEVELFYNCVNELAPLGLLAKVNIQIRELANEIGVTSEELKKQIKKEAGFCNKANCRSLGDMSREELNTVLNALREKAEFVGFRFSR